jgi:hypothetical protein
MVTDLRTSIDVIPAVPTKRTYTNRNGSRPAPSMSSAPTTSAGAETVHGAPHWETCSHPSLGSWSASCGAAVRPVPTR